MDAAPSIQPEPASRGSRFLRVTLAVLTLFDKVPLPLGVFGHEGSTIIVTMNGLRLLRR